MAFFDIRFHLTQRYKRLICKNVNLNYLHHAVYSISVYEEAILKGGFKLEAF